MDNRTEDMATNKTVYFALDNLEVYDYNCSCEFQAESVHTGPMHMYVDVSGITTVRTSSTTASTTTEDQATAPPKPCKY